MTRIEKLKQEVIRLYQKKSPNRADWADWLSKNHVFKVSSIAKDFAERQGVNPELAEAAGMLHDIADSEMSRDNVKHEQRSLELARDLQKKTGFNDQEIKVVVDDAIKFHSCIGKEKPKSSVGQIMATADAFAHLTTDFYLFGLWSTGEKQSFEKSKKWALNKIERDFHSKILYKEIKSEAEPYYYVLKKLLSDVFTNSREGDEKLSEAKLYTDGGSRGNPGHSAGAFVICEMDDNVVEKSGFYIGIATNNQAEYKALLKGLRRSKALGVRKLNVFMDSELVVKQLNGLYKIKNKDLEPLYRQVKELVTDFSEISFSYVPRLMNQKADDEVNRILDRKASTL